MMEVKLLFPRVELVHSNGYTVRYQEPEPPKVRYYEKDAIPTREECIPITHESKVIPVTEYRDGEIITEYFALSHDLQRLFANVIDGAHCHAWEAEKQRQILSVGLQHANRENRKLQKELDRIKSRSIWRFLKELPLRVLPKWYTRRYTSRLK